MTHVKVSPRCPASAVVPSWLSDDQSGVSSWLLAALMVLDYNGGGNRDRRGKNEIGEEKDVGVRESGANIAADMETTKTSTLDEKQYDNLVQAREKSQTSDHNRVNFQKIKPVIPGNPSSDKFPFFAVGKFQFSFWRNLLLLSDSWHRSLPDRK